MRCKKVLFLTTIVLFSLFSALESPTGSESYGSTSAYLYSFAHLSEPQVDRNDGRGRVYFENQTKWLAQQEHIKAVIITGDFMSNAKWYSPSLNETAWHWVKEGIERLHNASKDVIPVLGNWDAFYNGTYGGSDYRAFLEYAVAPANISTSTPNYTFTLTVKDLSIKLFFVVLTYRWWISAEGPVLWGIPIDQITWMGEQLNSTSLPAVIVLHSPPTKFSLSSQDQGVNEAVWTEASKHSNVFLILHGHEHDRNFRIYKARDGHPIYVEGLLSWTSGGQAEIQIYDVYSDRIKSYTFSPWLNKNFTGYEGDTFEIPFRGIMKAKSGLLKRNDFSSRQGSETGDERRTPKFNYSDFISPPSSVDLEYLDLVKRFIPKHHKTYWIQTYRKFQRRGDIQFMQMGGNNSIMYPLRSNVSVVSGMHRFYPNASDTSKNVTVTTINWHSIIYFINETAETADVYLFPENDSLMESWRFPYVSLETYGQKEILFYYYARMDDYIITNGTEVTFPAGTVLTLSNGTKIFPNGSINLLDFGTLVLMNVTIQIGTESKMMDLYGGDTVIVDYLDFWPSPVALFTYQPEIPLVNELVTFDASNSRDTNGWVVNYTWDFDDGNITTVTNTTDTIYWLINHNFTKQKTYAVTLTVTDNEGLVSSKTIYLNVIHAHDVAITSVTASPRIAVLGEPISVEVSVKNEGANNETFSVTAFYNATAIETKNVSLGIGRNEKLTFVWNTATVVVGTYNMSAQVIGVKGEIDFDDNVYIGDIVTIEKLNSTVSIFVSPQVLNLGENVTITGDISPLRRGVNVTIMLRRPEENWKILANVSTDMDGRFSYDWVPQSGRSYVKARWAGDDKTWGNESVVLLIIVYGTEPIQDEGLPSNYLMYAIVGAAITIITASVLIYFMRIRKRRKT